MATEEQLRDYLKRATADLARTRRQLAELEERAGEPIAVIGMASRFPCASTVSEFWELLWEGRDAVTEVPPDRFPIEQFEEYGVYTRRGAFLGDICSWDAQLFGLSPQEALRMDPQQRLLMELAWEALEDAGAPAERLAGSRTGVLVGLFDTFQYGRLQAESQGVRAFTDPYLVQGSSPSVAAGRLAYHFDLRGPALTVDTACSSSLVAVHLAAEFLRRGECELAIAGGISLAMMRPDTSFVYGCASSMLSPDGECRTFDAGANGYVMGEGGGIIVLERLSDAVRNGRRIHALVRGSAVNQDGRSNGLTAPSRPAQVAVIKQALAGACITPDDVVYVEAHGSATKLGDAIELGALHDVFGGRDASRALPVGAVKTNIGHTLSAAGIAGLIKTVLVLRYGHVPPNLHQSVPADAVPPDGTIRPASTPGPLTQGPRIGGVSSFGWSGTNAHVVLEVPADLVDPSGVGGEPGQELAEQLLPVSAAGDDALRARLGGLADRLTGDLGGRLNDVAYTLQEGRTAMEFRRAFVSSDPADAAVQLAAQAGAPGAAGVRRTSGRPRVAFLLPGVGDQYVGFGSGLYRDEPVFTTAADECILLASQYCEIDLRPVFQATAVPAPGGDLAVLFGRAAAQQPEDDPLSHAELAHPFMFTVEYALGKLLAAWGVTPDLLVGYSLGEYVAACLAGVFTLADALTVVTGRARLIAAAEPGHMLAVSADVRRAQEVIESELADGLGVAAVNGPRMTVLSGRPADVARARDRLAAESIACRTLRSAHPFHSALLEPVRDKLAALIGSVPRRAPGIAIVSNVTGEPLTAGQAADPEYWAEHLCSPVRFADSIGYCAARGVDAYLELGPGQMLGCQVRENLVAGAAPAVLGTLPGPWPAESRTPERTAMLAACGRLWELGGEIAFAAMRHGPSRLTDLPSYPFQRVRFWPDRVVGTAAAEPPMAGEPAAPERHEPGGHCYAPTWQQDLGPAAEGLPPGPLVIFADAGGAGSRLADLAAAAGLPVLEVRSGAVPRREGRCQVIDPAEPVHYREVFAAVRDMLSPQESAEHEPARGPVRVVHLWSLEQARPDGFAGEDDLRAAIRVGFGSLLMILQALGDLPARAGVRLLTVTVGAAEVIGGDTPAPEQAMVHGLGGGVRSELPGLAWRGVDLEAGNAGTAWSEHAAAAIAQELSRGDWDGSGAGLTAWRRGRRWLRGWASVPLAAAGSPWRADGTYLITGGTRGLGMILAAHLARHGVRRLALVARTDPGMAQGERAERARRDIEWLIAAGVDVLTLAADTADPGQLRAAIRDCRAHFGSLHGIVHAAGVRASGLAARTTTEAAAAVLAPKVLAMAPLTELMLGPAAERPELLVLYSSAVTAFGGVGEGDYCAANAVLDAYGAALASAVPDTRVVTVAWSPWRHDDWGDGAEGLAGPLRAYRSAHGFDDEVGCEFLDQLISAARGPLLALRQPLADAARDWAGMTDLSSLIGGASAGIGPRFPRPQLRTAFVAPRAGLETTIADAWCAALGIERVGRLDPFFELGGNSLVGMTLVARLEQQFRRPIPPALLFEQPTVAAFTAALEGTAAQTCEGAQTRGARRRAALGTRKSIGSNESSG